MSGGVSLKLMLQHKKELHEMEIEIKYPEMTERVTKLIQCIRQYDMERIKSSLL